MAGKGGEKLSDTGTKNNNNKCMDCKKDLNGRQVKSISCDFCHNWYCLACSKMKAALFAEMSKAMGSSVMWNCPHCRVALPGIRDLITRVMNLEAKLEQMCKEIEAKNVQAVLKTLFGKRKEKKITSRKLNKVIHSLQESKKSNQDERKTDDVERVMNLVKDTLNLTVDVERVLRLGKARNDMESKPRPLRFTVKNFQIDEKRMVLNAAKRLKNHENFSRVYFTPDLTVNQRHDAFKLREEKRRREMNGEKDLIIRRGKIITKSVNGDHEYVRGGLGDGADMRGSGPQTSDRGGARSSFH